MGFLKTLKENLELVREIEMSRKLRILFSSISMVNYMEELRELRELRKLPGTASPEANNVVDIAVPEFYISGHGVKV